MSIEETANFAIATIDELLGELLAIVEAVQGDGDHLAAGPRLDRWKSRAIRRIGEDIGAQEADQFEKDTGVTMRSYVDLVGNIVNESKRYEAYLTALREELTAHPETVLSRTHHEIDPPDVTGSNRDRFDDIRRPVGPVEDKPSQSPKIFIGHGGGSALRDQLELALWRTGFRPIIVEEMPSLGRNPDAKVDYYLNQCQFAVIFAEANNPSVQDEQAYPRLNIINEIARVRKILSDKLVVLLEDGLDLPSNESGAVTWQRFSGESMDKAIAAVLRELGGHGISGADV